ncbi:hypothetical protein DMC61_19765 [Amycolatopsis sp. WAC 04169]|uniref:hypothetical protein n=1 Tax=Amycolatopsis sp. WAC 04169 TaxID=2203197 RepID=UPI000F78463A|nr:hypothetical protein [Amycolatopsis sp. WAC 04169]RSN28778.1 hypothetical protein DMC61_19765 [Amycolatopsis sp. WAC 04169]
MSDSPSKRYHIAGEDIDFPDLADGRAIKNSATRFASSWSLPADAAFSLATAMVDPAADRGRLDAKDPFSHLQAIQTPAGKFLLAHRTTLWTSAVSGDGGNGRSRYSLQTTTENGNRTRPWPIGRHHKPAIIDYHTPSLTDMTDAVSLSAKAIRSPDLITQIRNSPRGVWNPPVVVLARAYVTDKDGTVHERFFLHTIEGSTRVEACHVLTDTAADAPLKGSDAPLDHLREAYGRLTHRFATTPGARRTLDAARGATMPALVVVGVVEEDMTTPIPGGFPAVVNDYVESVHVQPRPFSDVAQANVIGERFVLTLRDQNRLDAETADALLGREPDVAGKATVRAAKLVRAVTAPENEPLIRDFVITDEGSYLTKVKRAKLIGPLVVRQFRDPAATAERALMRAFTPDLLLKTQWKVTGVDSETLRTKAEADVAAGRFDTPVLAELIARGGPALCAAGLLLGDQGSTVSGIRELRGSVEKVVEGLARNLGGVNVLADAVAWADGEQQYLPRKFDLEGAVITDDHDDAEHFVDDWRQGNMGIRALAFTNGTTPTSTGGLGEPSKPAPKTPDEEYKAMESELIADITRAGATLRYMYHLKDELDRKIMERLRLRPAKVYKEFPEQLTTLRNRYGSDDPFAVDFEDDKPLDEPLEDDDLEDEDADTFDEDEEN